MKNQYENTVVYMLRTLYQTNISKPLWNVTFLVGCYVFKVNNKRTTSINVILCFVFIIDLEHVFSRKVTLKSIHSCDKVLFKTTKNDSTSTYLSPPSFTLALKTICQSKVVSLRQYFSLWWNKSDSYLYMSTWR